MPRQARLDAPGTLHHVIIRGSERKKIISDDRDRKDFVSRMGTIAVETETLIYAWALMTNHAHILLRSGSFGLPRYMRRLLSGYATSYNRRHRRHGHLFQNRYKSIVCEQDPYFKELVRYIHLNPLRTNLVDNLSKLDRYKYCGHSVIMGRVKNDWQDRGYVLKWFGSKAGEAKRAYRQFVKKGIDQGRRSDLVGGGLIRSQGGWSAVKAMRRFGVREKSDERMQRVASEVENKCRKENVSVEALQSGSRRQKVSAVRSQLAKKLVEEFGLSLTETGRQLGVSASAIAKTLNRLDKHKSH
jgi:REP element-mobilizing transposase RayT